MLCLNTHRLDSRRLSLTKRLWCGCLLALGGSIAPAPAGELGIPVIDTFNVRDYGEHNQTWVAVQDRAGQLYVGNRNLVLVYDGQSWESIETGGLFVRGLALDDDDRIWVGAVGEIGYLESNDFGGRTYVSLTEHLPPEDQGTLFIAEVTPLSHGVYFASQNGILRWHENTLTRLFEGPMMSWTIGDELWVHGPGQPIRAFDGKVWRIVLEDDEVLDAFIHLGVRQADGGLLLVTNNRGLYRLRDGVALPWAAPINATLQTHGVSGARLLGDDVIGIRLRGKTTMLTDFNGALRHDLNAENQSLPVSTTLGFGHDKSGDIWLLQGSGLSRITWPSTVTHFDERRGLGTATVKIILRFKGNLYVGTNDGLHVLRPLDANTLPVVSAHFETVAGPVNEIWALAVADQELLVGSRQGLGVVDAAGKFTAINADTDHITALHVPRENPQHAWVGTSTSLHLLRRTESTWETETTFGEIPGVVRALVEDRDGAIWASVDARGYYRITRAADAAREGAPSWAVEHYPGGHGLPTETLRGLSGMANRGDDAVFLDGDRVFRFDPAAKRFQPILDPRQALPHPVQSMPTLGTGRDGSNWVRTLRNDPDAGPWKGRVFWRVSAEGNWEALPFAVAERVGENPTMFEEPTDDGSVLWIGGSEGLARVEVPKAFVRPRPFRTLVRQVLTATGDPLPLTVEQKPALPFDQQSLSFAFATNRVDDRNMRFQTRLTAFDDAWSPWSPVASLNLNHLAAGEHVLQVRARDVEGRLGESAAFAFTVLAPWWETIWARTLGGLLFGGLIVLGVRWRLGVVQRRNIELSLLVDQRTRELKQNEAHLIEARDAADAANHAKSEFLASMSHELRTPLNAILGFTQIVRREDGLSTKGRSQLDTVSRNGQHLLGMINEVLDLSKIEAQKLTLHAAPCSLPRLASQLADTFEPRAAAKGLDFRLELDPGASTRVMVDEPKLRQVLINLLANAIKFTRSGEVVLAVTGRAGRVRFAVRDTGIGISEAERSAVFEPFHQTRVDPSLTEVDHGGTGLGLPISQRIIELMGGVITVESKVDHGSCFHFALQLPPAPAEPRPATRRHIVGYQGPRRRALIVDDIATNRTILSEMLTPIGFTTTEVDTGEGALAALATQPTDVVLLDLRLPGINGEEVARQLSARGRARPRLIAVSASVFDIDQDQADRAGCDAFVPKPVDEAVLLATIAEQLDLEWITEDVAPDAAEVETLLDHTALPVPSVEVLESLRTFVRQGDLTALRDRIAELTPQELDPRTGRHLNHLAATFATSALRAWLNAGLDQQRPPQS